MKYSGESNIINSNRKKIEQKEMIIRIKKRQQTIKDSLIFLDSNLTVTTKGELSKGCRACKDGTWLCLFPGIQCTATCHFCPNPHTINYKDNLINDEEFGRPENPRTIDEIKVMIDLFAKKLEGISYSGGEPFLYLK